MVCEEEDGSEFFVVVSDGVLVCVGSDFFPNEYAVASPPEWVAVEVLLE